ncbi:hypothetical protein P3T76_002960 [Phytophthora citrophthora]|uniref:Crinkler effector protein N-terminal domain-containing protein n=1 Tax=Phytophthora citrophthora TaxID=4793 RepID=A0AAD9GWF9_9STRA|nr:hypothetical protein P3T76_002960 [Phytophthora citrophthora]
MVKLFCAVVGAGKIFSVDVKLSDSVTDAKSKIKKKLPNSDNFDAPLLKLYMAKVGDAWLKSKDEAIKVLKENRSSDQINNLTQKHLELDNADRLRDDECFGSTFKETGHDIQLLVVYPDGYEFVEYVK